MATAVVGRAAQAKAARQKKIVIVGGVLLAIVLVIQGPRMMKQLKGPSSEAVPAAPVPAPATPGVPPAIPATPTPATGIPTTPAAPGVTAGKLVSFERFDSKDPFVQQVTATGASASDAATPASAGAATNSQDSGAGSQPVSATSGGSATAAPTAFRSDAGAGAKPAGASQTATIQVNGTVQAVSESKTFPKADPVFKLISIGDKSVQIAIADGSFKDGDKTITLTEGKPVTLLNTADGNRYKLLLVSSSG
jgi:hypothetical protein